MKKKKEKLVRKGFWVTKEQAKKVEKGAKFDQQSESEFVRDIFDEVFSD